MRLSLLLGWCFATAAAAEEPPKHLLADTGVRVVLPPGWTASEWTPEQLQAKRDDGSARLYAWATPGQAPVHSGDLAAWTHIYEGMLAQFKGKDPEIRSSDIKTIAGRETIRVDVGFTESGRKGVVAGATTPVGGRMFHIAVVGLADRAPALDAAIESMTAELDIKEPAAPRAAGAELTAATATIALPPGFFVPTAPEEADLRSRIDKLGMVQLDGCWTAVRPVPGSLSDLMVGCPATLNLGVVDALSFTGVDADLRTRLFGAAPVAPAESVTAGDRPAFLYRIEASGAPLRLAVLPTSSGAERIWALAVADRGDELDESLRTMIGGAQFKGPHPTTMGDWVRYYLAYRSTSPAVIVPGLLLLVGAVVGIRLLARPRTSPVDDIA